MSKKEISRRLFLKGTAAAGATVAAASLLAGCGTEPTPSTVAPTQPASTAAPTTAPTVPQTTAAPTEPATTQAPEPEFVWETGVTDAQSVTGDPNRTWTLCIPMTPTRT